MTGIQATAADELLALLKELWQAAGSPSYATLVRQAAAQQPSVAISPQRLSDWFRSKAVPADPAVVRFLVEYLQPRAARTGRYQQRPLASWLRLHQEAVRQRQAGSDERRRSTAPPPSPGPRLGRPVDGCDPLALEVHPAIEVPDRAGTGDRLPAYVPRAHDDRLRQAADRVMAGESVLVTLVGGSSTGKTRACWEVAQYLDRQQPGRWWLWHPYDPTRPEAAAAALDQAGPHTIVWLNEAQFYLAPPDAELGERIAAALRTLLQDRQRGPVLVLATLWPQHWSGLTIRPPADQPDPHGQARALLTGTAITVADAFTGDEVAGLTGAGTDLRLRQAAAHAEGGRITQYLAGAPDLEQRYRTAPAAARAIIQVAMDARRLGHPLALPHALLEQAAPGYLDDHDWDDLGEDWLEQALAYTATPCKGARGPLTRIRPRPGDPAPAGGQPCYRLADYLEQAGRRERAGVYPPKSLWTAFTTTATDPDLLRQLGEQAEDRGRYQHAIWLYIQAADRGDTDALRALAARRAEAGDAAGAEALYRQAADCGATFALRSLARLREEAGDAAGAEALYRQAVDCGDTFALQELAWLREEAGDAAGAEALAVQAADRGDTDAMRALAALRAEAGDAAGAAALYRQAADRGDTDAMRELAWRREQAGDAVGAEALYRQAADRGDPFAMRELAWRREQAGDAAGAAALYRQAADRGDIGALQALAALRAQAGDVAGAEALYRQAADCGDPFAFLVLAGRREAAGDVAGTEELVVQAADRGDTGALRFLAGRREVAGDAAGAEALYRQAADRGDTGALLVLARRREQAGDVAGAEALYRQAADRGDPLALRYLAERWEKAGNATDADRVQRFGLTGGGEVARALDFGPYGGLMPVQ